MPPQDSDLIFATKICFNFGIITCQFDHRIVKICDKALFERKYLLCVKIFYSGIKHIEKDGVRLKVRYYPLTIYFILRTYVPFLMYCSSDDTSRTFVGQRDK